MIVEMLLNLIYNICDMLFFFDIPSLPAEVSEYFEVFLGYIQMGASILANYTPFAYLLILLAIVCSVDVAIMIYHVIMWILRKIPVLNIS